MLTKFRCAASLAALLTCLTPAYAGQIVIGIGTNDFDENSDVQLDIEILSDPFTEFWGADISYGGVLVRDNAGDTFVGVGLSAIRPIGNGPWFVEGGFFPGIFNAGTDETDLGNPVEFRTVIGVGRAVTAKTKVSVGVSHLSNGGLADSNPGVNKFSVRLRHSF